MTSHAPRRLGASLHEANYRLFFVGQLLSSVGTWAHQVAESWLVLQLTGSGAAVGLVVAARIVPVLTLGLWGGAVADRHDRRRVLYITQLLRAAAAAILGLLALSGAATTPLVLATAIVAGVANAVDNPVRRAFIGDLVDDELMLNAVSLNSSVMAVSRVVGPLLAGVVIASVGVAWCFVGNAVSYVAVLVALAAMDPTRFRRRVHADPERQSVRDGLRYVRSSPAVFVPLVMVGFVSAFAWNWETLLALYATRELGGGPRLYSVLFAVLSLGTLVGALVNATRARVGIPQLITLAAGLGAVMIGTALVPGLPLAIVMLAACGAGAALFNTASNAVVQLAARGEYHGRVMAVFSALFVGTKGIGGVTAGALAELGGTRLAIVVGGCGCLTASAIARWWVRSPADVEHRGQQLDPGGGRGRRRERGERVEVVVDEPVDDTHRCVPGSLRCGGPGADRRGVDVGDGCGQSDADVHAGSPVWGRAANRSTELPSGS